MLCAFTESLAVEVSAAGEESRRIGRLLLADPAFPVSPGFVFTADAEAGFYRTNNLPERLRALFERINPRRLDEDALEAACERARALVAGSYLLEDFIAQAYTALANAGVSGALHLRRPDQAALETGEGRRGALLALKRLWARDWDFEPTLERLDRSGSVAIEERPALVLAGGPGEPDQALSEAASRVLGEAVRARAAAGRLTGLEGSRQEGNRSA